MIAGYACWLEVLYFRMFSRSESKYSLLLLLTLLLWYYWNTYNSKPFHPPPVRSAGRTFSAANCCTLFSFSPSLASRAFRWHHFWRWILTDADWSSLWLVIPTVEKTLEILKICNRENMVEENRLLVGASMGTITGVEHPVSMNIAFPSIRFQCQQGQVYSQ